MYAGRSAASNDPLHTRGKLKEDFLKMSKRFIEDNWKIFCNVGGTYVAQRGFGKKRPVRGLGRVGQGYWRNSVG